MSISECRHAVCRIQLPERVLLVLESEPMATSSVDTKFLQVGLRIGNRDQGIGTGLKLSLIRVQRRVNAVLVWLMCTH